MHGDFIEQDENFFSKQADDVRHHPNDAKVMEDGGKEDMFVDCPEDWISNDGRNNVPDNKEAKEIPETPKSLEEKDEIPETQVNESGNETHNNDMIGELEHLRALLARRVDEKESFEREYEVDCLPTFSVL